MAQEFTFLSHFFGLNHAVCSGCVLIPGAAIGPGPPGCKTGPVGVSFSGHANEGVAILMTSATEL
jgi:hypothetical protein